MDWINVNGAAYTYIEYRTGRSYNGIEWERVPPLYPSPALIERNSLDLAMAVARLYAEIGAMLGD